MLPSQLTALSYFIRMGWTPEQAAGVVANLVAESSLNPAAVGDGGQAYGIAQWHPDRQANFAAVIGRDIKGSSLEEQLAFVHAELNRFEKSAGDALRLCATASEAGACISTKYERPADRDGEAAKRAALAESIFAQYGTVIGAQPEAPIEEQPAQVAKPQGGTMGAGLLLSLLPTVLQMFAPRAQAAAAKITGQPPEVAGQFVQSLFDQLQTLTGKTDPIQATAALQANPDPKVVAQLEDHTLDFLDKIAPMIDRLAKYDQAEWAAGIAGKDAASERAAKDKYDSAPTIVPWTMALVSVVSVTLVGLFGWMIYLGKDVTVLVALLGPLLTLVFKNYGEIFAYRFDSTPNSAAKDATIAALAKAQK